MTEPSHCPVCDAGLDPPGWPALAAHLVACAAESDDPHVMWLNRNVTKHATDAERLVPLLRAALEGPGTDPAARIRR